MSSDDSSSHYMMTWWSSILLGTTDTQTFVAVFVAVFVAFTAGGALASAVSAIGGGMPPKRHHVSSLLPCIFFAHQLL